MLTFWGADDHRFCDHLSRRNFLTVGSLGLTGLTLADLQRLKAQGAVHSAESHKAVIMVFLGGGPPHLDMYDMKPEAPAEFRGPYRPIKTNVPGMEICELMPLQAQLADKLAIIRGHKTSADHEDKSLFHGQPFSPSARPPSRPTFGSIVSWLRKGRSEFMPYVTLGPKTVGDPGDPAYLGAAHRPFVPQEQALENLRLHSSITLDRLADRKALQGSLDTIRRDIDTNGELAGVDAFNARALEIITTNTDAFDVSREPDKVRERYGTGTRYLQARRLVEAGVSVVSLSASGNWDLHGDLGRPVTNLRLPSYVPELDRGVAALVSDLHERGLDKDVVVVVWGEMGRSPKIVNTANLKDGRDHWPYGFVLLAGGGLKMGQVIGDTGPRGERSKDRPYTPQNVLATLYHVLGIDAARATVTDLGGRPRDLLDDPTKIVELV